MIMNKDHYKITDISKVIPIFDEDPSTNEEDINIEDIVEGWDGSAYGSMKWDHEKKKWVKSKL